MISEAVNYLGGNWLLVSFLAPMFWGLVNIVDVYFVGGIYDDEFDGTIISGLFQMVPWIFLFFWIDTAIPPFIVWNEAGFSLDTTLIWAFAGGMLFTLAFYFYFKALFHHNDASLLQILWNLCVIAVPVLAIFMLKEELPAYKYLGMFIVFMGAGLLSFHPGIIKKFSKKYFWIMIGAVLALSLSMIFEARAYSELNGRGYENGFWIGFLFFSLGAFAGGVFFAIIKRRNPMVLIRKYFKVFFIAEGLAFLGTLSSQRAIDLAPSVSYVATVETFVPVFILAYAIAIILSHKIIDKGNRELIKTIYAEQINGARAKVLATIVMAVGVYIINI